MSKETLETFALGFGERVVLQRLLNQQAGREMAAEVIGWFNRDLALKEDELLIAAAFGENILLETYPVAFTLTAWRLSKVREVLRALDATGGVRQEHLTLFAKFLPTFVSSNEDPELAAEYAAMKAANAPEPEPVEVEAIETVGE